MISIIVPVYNVENFLDKCIQSILNQTFKKFELILVNDGSKDNSLEICEKYKKLDDRITIFSQENKGLSEARNAGIKLANNPYITFIDSDDWIENNMLDILYKNIVEKKADVVNSKFFIDYSNKKDIQNKNINNVDVYNKKEALYELFRGKRLANYACGKLYKTEIIKDIKFPPNTLFEDVYVMYKVFDKSNVIVDVSAKLYHYVQHKNSISHNYFINPKSNLDFYKGLMKQLEFLENNKVDFFKYKKTKTHLAMHLMRFKRGIIFVSDLDSKEFKEQEVIINKGLIKAIKGLSILDFGILDYIKFMITLHKPKIMLKYLKFKRR